jgi:TRAP-type C4-dicarboxylate transport system permease small subunit
MKNQLLAQSMNINGTSIQGPLDSRINTLGDLISRVLTFLLPMAGIVLLFVLIWGGYDYMMSQGNPEKIKGAQAKITTGLIGFFLLISSYLIVRVIAAIFGLSTGIL